MTSPDIAVWVPLLVVAVAAVASLAAWALTARRWRRLLRSADGRSLEVLLIDQQDLLVSLRGEVAAARDAHAEILDRLGRCIQGPALLRFNAFSDTGSDLSFALALLDSAGGGVVLSSLYGREDARVYAKPVAAGESKYPLTDEEKEAIRRAWRR